MAYPRLLGGGEAYLAGQALGLVSGLLLGGAVGGLGGGGWFGRRRWQRPAAR
ncbi:MAG: hypothetical protein WKG07_39215 [Hymenobacter sp.]